jgi:hypothetical protein
MERPADFDNVQAYGDFKPLPAGGYVCRIMGVEETAAKSSGAPMIKISLDIAEGEYKDYFANMYRNDTRADKKWNAGAIVNQLVYDTNGNNSTNRGFKTFCTAAEESNPGFKIQWGAAFGQCFRNRLIGVLFRKEAYLGTDNKEHWNTKALSFRSAGKIRKGDFQIPEEKPLSDEDADKVFDYGAKQYNAQGGYAYGQGNSYTTYSPAPAQAASVPSQPAPQTAPQTANFKPDLSDFEEIAVSDLPF